MNINYAEIMQVVKEEQNRNNQHQQNNTGQDKAAIKGKKFKEVIEALGDAVAGVDVEEASPGFTGEIALYEPLREAMRAVGVDSFYSHQMESYFELKAGKSLVLATPTASGKTNCYLPTVFESALLRGGNTLLIYPLKALISDQMQKFRAINNELGAEKLLIGQITGDISKDERQAIFKGRPNIICINPDVLHHQMFRTGSYSGWEGWKEFLRNLKYIVIDEVHSYLGSFGGHFGNVMERLRLCIDKCGGDSSKLQYIVSTATIGNPREFCGTFTRLPNEKVHVITKSGAPKQYRVNVRLQPSEFPNFAASDAVLPCILQELSTLVFCNSRKSAKTLANLIQNKLANLGVSNLGQNRPENQKNLSSQVAFFHGSLPDDKRARIINGLASNRIKALITTNALEAGIDLPNLDVVVLKGFAGSLMSHRQRLGRCGRNSPGLVIFVPYESDPLDSFYSRNPKELLEGEVESARVNPSYPTIVAQHLICSAAEIGLYGEQVERFGEFGNVIANTLIRQGKLLRSHKGLLYTKEHYPHSDVSIRGTKQQNVTVKDAELETIEEMSLDLAQRELHPGAIYETQEDGVTTKWETVDFNEKTLIVSVKKISESDKGFNLFTESKSQIDIDKQTIISEPKLIDLGDKGKIRVSLWFGCVHSTVTGYEKFARTFELCCTNRKCSARNQQISKGETCSHCGRQGKMVPKVKVVETVLFNPVLSTKLSVPIVHIEFNSDLGLFLDSQLNKIKEWLLKTQRPPLETDATGNFLAAHSLSHLLIKAIPRMMLASSQDINSLTIDKGVESVIPGCVSLYDTSEGGNGCCEAVYDSFNKLCDLAYSLAQDCECATEGCPKCLYSNRCPELNKDLNKMMGMTLLEHIVETDNIPF